MTTSDGVRWRWGVAGTGGIAERFVAAMGVVEDGTVEAVCSRTAARAAEFAAAHGIARSVGSYAALADDDGIDAVYVATPHPRHMEDTLRYLAAGRHVLCEKPLAINRAQALRMVTAARDADRFLMEAIWSRFLPSYRALGELLSSGRIGDPLLVEADFGFRRKFDPTHRLFDPALGGGALLDLGIYPLQLATLVLGLPEDDGVHAVARLGETGVDEQVAAVLRHAGGTLSVIKAATRTPLACTARIAGTRGAIELPAFMHCPEVLHVQVLGETETIPCPIEGDGLRYEIEEVHRCLAAGLRESPAMPLDESVALAGIMDTIRAQIGLRYAADDEEVPS